MLKRINMRMDLSGITFLFFMVYMISYITRINYGTIIAEMEAESGISRSLLSMSITGSFITYGVGQIISGICGDRFSAKKLILYGLMVSCFMNILIPICKTPYQMLFVWCINGFAQSFMWPPMVKLMVALMDEEEYKRACTTVSYGCSIGTVILYLVSPLIISVAGWKSVFFFSALCGFAMLIAWNKFCPDIKSEQNKKDKSKISLSCNNIYFAPSLIGAMIAIIFQGMLRDGVSTWMPSYISDVYNVSSVISILTGVILPLFSVVSFAVAIRLYVHKFKNPLTCAGIFFICGTLSALAINIFSGKNAAMSVLSFALLTGSMHGINLMLISMLPHFFSRMGNVSTMSGVLNSCTYIGSAISSYGIAVLSEIKGWDFTVLLWAAIAGIGSLLCFICAKPLIRKLLK